MKYRNVYWFDVADRIAEGKTVWLLDRMAHDVLCVNSMGIEIFIRLKLKGDCDPERFEMWYEEESENA